MEIAKTGNVSLLNSKNNLETWEEIVRLNCVNNEMHEYINYLNALRSLSLLVNQYITVKAHISKLSLPVFTGDKIDLASVEYLRSKGYEINMESKEKYIESLKVCLKKRENLMTRINMKRKEIERLSIQQKGGSEEKGIEQLLASLSFQLGFTVSDDITLARFNEYNRIIKIQQEQHGRNK
jgi:lipase chaperone LimK